MEHRIETARQHEIRKAAPDYLEGGTYGLPAGSAGGVNRGRVTADAELASQHSETGVRLTAAKRHRVGGEVGVQQAVGTILAVRNAKLMDRLEFAEGNAEH